MKRTRVRVSGMNGGDGPEYFEGSQPEIVRYEIARPERKGTIERLQETVIDNTVNRYDREDLRELAAVRDFVERNPDIIYADYESNPVFRFDITITRRGLIFRREEAVISSTITPNRRFRAQR